MKLVEQHLVKRTDPRYAAIDQAAFASKNLYNQGTYQMRQAFIHEGKYLPYAEIFHRVKHLECYQALPRKVSNSILTLLDKNWKSFRNGLAAYTLDPSKFTGRPKLPGYKHKEHGRNILIYDIQAIGKRAYLKSGKIVPSGLGIEIGTKVAWEDLDCVRIIPQGPAYVVEVVYRKEIKQAAVDPTLVAAIDLGVNTLAAVTSTKRGFVPLLINGRPLKHLNAYNQTFVSIPHSRFIDMLSYKAQLVGIVVVVREESYTSKASFLDLDEIPTYNPKRTEKPIFSGKREKRGLYRAKDGRRINADINGSYNILRKEFPNAFCESQVRPGQQIGGPALAPCRLVAKRREETGSSVSASRLNEG